MRLKIKEIVELIKSGKTFEATAFDGSFTLKVTRYVPYVCTAIHDGNKIREELISKIKLQEYERWFEEDPHTGDFIKAMPITMIVHDSRFEYDLNRKPENAIYEEAWGKQVWSKKLTTKEKQESLKKHSSFYQVLGALVGKIESLYDGCVVYDMHTYNHRRWDRAVPLFNVGTEHIDRQRYAPVVDNWLEELKQVKVETVANVTAENDVFFGRGYNVEYITTNFNNTLVLATEVKKVFCNELTGEDFPELVAEIQSNIKTAIINNAHFFTKAYTYLDPKLAVNLLGKKEDPNLFRVDKQMHRLLRNFELLAYVNPNNSNIERKKFFKNKFNVEPTFKYAPIKINPYELKQKLSAIPTQSISDVSIRHMYEAVISSYFDKIDLLSELNSSKFLFNSLRYFHRPSKKDISNAEYLMHLPPIPFEPKKVPTIPIDEVMGMFRQASIDYGFDCKIELSKKVLSQVMVLNSSKTIKIRPDAQFTQKQVNALIEHEIGVHMVTTQNSNLQPLKIFNMGLPVNTETQEGLAILSEIVSGNMTLDRLQKLAYRVLITDMMCSGASFMDCFKRLHNDYQVNPNDAFTIVTRIFRGGGFTKDFLYLSGLAKVLKFWQDGNDIAPLLVGKTSLEYYDLITEMIEREIIIRPKYLTKSLTETVGNPMRGLYGYILSGLKS